MKFLLAKWPFWVNALALIFMVMLGGYLFNDVIGFSGVFQAFSVYSGDVLYKQDIPLVEWDWQVGMLAGVFIGSVCGALLNKSWKVVPAFEEAGSLASKTFGTPVFGMIAGFLVMFGSIMAGETFYGQVVAAMELSAGAWAFLIVALITAGITALFIERRGGSAGKGGSK